ncbi:MAG: F0F1 ATP synthase subunit B [Elusimicrobia bacterium]|nr:F0F1 ATP synthase subunit B [Elusimicrobiota bacterium]MDE2312592.1 F0F1 ATP synthase subunit B [Elusimicrobiota bacterium]
MNKLLTPEPGILIWTIVTFLALVALLKKFAWGPLLAIIDEREKHLKSEREAAESARAEAERLKKEIESQMAGLQAAGRELIDKARGHAEALSAQIKTAAEEEARKIKDKTAAELAAEKERLSAGLRKEVAGLSVLAAEKLLRRSVDDGVRKTVLDSFFKDLENKESARN